MLRSGLLAALLGLGLCITGSATAQVLEATLTGDEQFEDFGQSVALSGDTLAIGEPGDAAGLNSTGAVNIFVNPGSGWSLQAELREQQGTLFTHLGHAVALDGDVLLTGGWGKSDGSWSQPGYQRGAAWIFRRTGSSWSLEAFLQPPSVLAYDHFGRAVALDGDVAAVGAPYADPAGDRSGRVLVFRHAAGSWSLEATLVAPDAAAGARFGNALALSGTTLAIGALGAGGELGGVYVYVHDGAAWQLQQQLAAAASSHGDRFGAALDLEADTLAIGAPGRDAGGQGNAGSLAIFTRTAATWSQQASLALPSPRPLDNLGSAVALSGDLVIAGAPDDDDAAPMAGAAYVWRRSGTVWSLHTTLISPLTVPGDACGTALALDGGRAAVGNRWRENVLALGSHGAIELWTGLEEGGR